MRTSMIFVVAGAAALGACGQGNQSAEASSNLANTAAKAAKKVPYCFFKDASSKDWAASAGKDGNVTIKGKAYVADGRYKAALKPAEIDGATASLQLGMPQNDTGFSTEDGWWTINQTLEGSSAVQKVDVLCGAKTLASLQVKGKG